MTDHCKKSKCVLTKKSLTARPTRQGERGDACQEDARRVGPDEGRVEHPQNGDRLERDSDEPEQEAPRALLDRAGEERALRAGDDERDRINYEVSVIRSERTRDFQAADHLHSNHDPGTLVFHHGMENTIRLI